MQTAQTRESMPVIASVKQGLDLLESIYTHPLYEGHDPKERNTLSLRKQARYVQIRILQLVSSGSDLHPYDEMSPTRANHLINKL